MPSISITEYERLKIIESKYNNLKLRRDLEPFVDSFAKKLATIAAYTAMENWPREFKSAFDHAALEYPSLAELYKENHV